jgi:acetylornithine/succinyldiaminopimelate/putrescine aminotransferase
LLLAIEFDREIAADVLNSCLESGLLLNRVKPNALRFMPPLIIGNGEVDEAINILDKVLAAV